MKDLDKWKQEELALHDAKLAEAYEKKRESVRHGKFFQDYWMERMLRAVPKKKNPLVLDYCCGTSILYPHLKKVMRDATYVGIDLSSEMLDVGKRRFGKNKNFKVLQRDGEDLRLKEKFDVVIARGAIHHLPRPLKGLDEVREVLKEDGVLVISEPAANPVIKGMRWIMYKLNSHFSSKHRSFTYGQIRKMLYEADYEVLSVERFGFLGYIFGFPDIIPFYKIMPFWLFKGLVKFDEFLGKVPLIRGLSFSVIITARPHSS